MSIKEGGWDWGEVMTCRACILDEIHMGGATPMYRARMGIGMKRGGRKGKEKKGERGRNERVLVQFVDRA